MIRRFLATLLLLPSICWAQSAFENYVTSTSAPTLFFYGSESSGSLVNHGSSGTGYNLAAGTAPSYSQTGVNASRGTSLRYTSASSQFMHVNKNDTGSGPGDVNGAGLARTFECWTNQASLTAGTLLSTGKAESGAAADRVWGLGMTNTPKAFYQIFDTTGSTLYSTNVGGTTLSTGTWYMISATWDRNSTTNTLYVNGVQDGQVTTIGGTGNANAVQWWAMGRREGDDTSYYDGYAQDCIVVGSAQSSTTILNRYNFGIITNQGSVWPWMTKRPELPRFRDDNYWQVAKRDGWLTGQFLPKALRPQYLALGSYPIFPDGNTGNR